MEYRNARYINNAGCIDCEINHEKFGWIPYTLDPSDTDQTVDNDALLDAMAKNGDVASYVPPSQEEIAARLEHSVRRQRDEKLVNEVDVIAGNVLRWAALSEAQKQAWAEYRQALLDVPQQTGFPDSVVWPVCPE